MAESRTAKIIHRLEVTHGPGLNHSQLMLMVGLDTRFVLLTRRLIRALAVERGFAPSASREEDVGFLELCGLLGCGQFQHQHVRYILQSYQFLI